MQSTRQLAGDTLVAPGANPGCLEKKSNRATEKCRSGLTDVGAE